VSLPPRWRLGVARLPTPSLLAATVPRTVRRLLAGYAVVAVVWIVLSDLLVEALLDGDTESAAAQTIKGLCFVAGTVVVVLVLVRRLEAALVEATRSLDDLDAGYRVVFEASPEAMWIGDLDTLEFLEVNQAACDRYGLTREEFLARTALDIRPEEDAEAFLRIVDGTADANGVRRHLTADGRVLWVEILAHDLSWHGRRACLVIARDVTSQRERDREREAAAAEAQRARELLEAVLLYSTDLVSIHAPSGRPMFESRAFLHPPHLRTSQPLPDAPRVVHVDDDERAQRSFLDALARPGELVGPVEFRIVTPEGEIRWVSSTWRNLIGHPAVGGVLAHTRDITERRAEQEQTLQLQKMEAVGRMAGGVAHDFNNLLTAVLGHADLVLTAPDLDPAVAHAVTQIRAAGERGAALTGQLLAVTRHRPVEPVVLDVGDAVRTLEPMLRPLLGADVALRLELAPTPMAVRADPGHIDQVLLNLVVNARDAVRAGGTITIAASVVVLDADQAVACPGLQPGPHVRLDVVDDGVGMDGDVLAHVFEPFFTTKADEGNGLGLATVYGIVSQAGGHIAIASDPGVGTTARVHLPFAGDPVIEQVALPQRSHAGETARGERVLLVEDDELVRRLAERVLVRQGYRVATAERVDAVLDAAESLGTPDVVVTDVVLPDGRADDVVALLAERYRPCPVLYTSGYTDGVVLEGGESELGSHFLPKPYRLDQLVRRVAELLASSHDGTPARAEDGA
jgi:two-component system, cell cycle sensor histidine kinase and response regulator CckA